MCHCFISIEKGGYNFLFNDKSTTNKIGIDMGLLDGKKALVTGSRKGIGRGIALTFAAEGADVGINDIVDDQITKSVLESAAHYGSNASLHVADVSTVHGIQNLIDDFVDFHSGIDIFVNNAIFSGQSKPLFETDESYWDSMMNLSLKGYFFGAKHAASHMITGGNGGRIISISSVHAYGSMKDWTPYGIAKAGLRRMAKGLAVDLKGTDITVNCIAPGAISNRLPEDKSDHSFDGPAHPLNLMKHIPSQRGGLPSDIANAALYLSSKLGAYVNGETILVDGGMIASLGPKDS